MLESVLEIFQHLAESGIKLNGAEIASFILVYMAFKRRGKYKIWNGDSSRNQKAMMNHMGIGDQWQGHIEKSWKEEARSFKRLFSSLRAAIRREGKLMKALTSNISKKLAAFIITAGITALNKKLGLDIDPNAIYGLYALVIAYILGQSHVDAKKALSSTVNATVGALESASTTTNGQPIQSVTQPPTSQAEATQLMNELTSLLNPIYNEVKTGKFTDATMKALQAATDIRDYLKAGESDATKSA